MTSCGYCKRELVSVVHLLPRAKPVCGSAACLAQDRVPARAPFGGLLDRLPARTRTPGYNPFTDPALATDLTALVGEC